MFKKKRTALIAMSGLVVALILILMSIRNYQDLLDALVYNEQKHLLTIADSTAKAIETYFTNEERSLEIFVSDSRFREYFDSLTTSNDRGLTAPIEMYYTIGYPRVQNIEVADANGHILDRYPHFSNDSDMETDISQESVVSKVIETEAKAYGTTFFENGESYIYLSYPIVDDDAFVGFIRIKLSTDVIYKRYVEPIKTGNKGYASVKTSDGVFLMHPKSSQIGQNVLEIRRKEFPDYDWSELEALFEKQMLGLSGSEVYHSVWVTDDEPKRTLKFNGYTPAYVGDDFWIVTVSSDYEEAVRGIKKNYYYTILVIAFIFMSIVFSFIYVYMIKQKDKELKNKSRYLDEVRKLNAELEEDIEQRKKLEIELLEKMEENKKKEVLMLHQSRYVAMGEMIGNIAHQWRQPLNTLTMILSNIEDLIGDDEIDAEFCDQLMDKARVLIRNMSETIEDFRYFVKPKVKNENFYVYRCVDTTLELCEERLNIEDVHVDVSGDPHVRLFGQANQLSQVIVNLINNSIDAFIEKDIMDRNIEIAFREDGSDCIIDVRDSAGGIDKSIMSRIFEPYFTTKDGKNGTGLGMYMSRIIVEKYFEGHMKVENVPNGIMTSIIIPTEEGEADND